VRRGFVIILFLRRLFLFRLLGRGARKTADLYGVGCADVGAGRHSGDVSGHGDKDTGRCGPRSRWGYINDNRDRAVKNGLNHIPGRFNEPSGSIQNQD
jgi:hypothetical protein